MNLTDTYINHVNQKKEKEEIKQEVLFGQVTGLVLIIASFLNFLSTESAVVEFMMKVLMIIGGILFIAGIVFPYILYYPIKVIKQFVNKIFQLIFSVILIMIYILFVVPVGWINKKKWKENYEFISWDQKNNNVKWKGFVRRKDTINQDQDSQKRDGKLKSAIKIIGYFMKRKQYIFIPILCILILLGFLFFFVTSSVVTPMIYTIF